MTYEQIYNNVIFKLVNKDKNEELLKTVPYVEYLDLAIIFYLNLPEMVAEDGIYTMLVTNYLVEEMHMDVNELMKCAIANTPKILGLKVQGLFTTIADCLGDESLKNEAEKEDKNTPAYVVTNNNNSFGASVVIYKDLLKNLSLKLQGDLYVIPCSLHEVIVIKCLEGFRSPEELKETIHYVNRSQVRPEDVLSDSLYYYSQNEDALCIV